VSEDPSTSPFVPPAYPFDQLGDLAELAARLEGGMVDLSIGTPCDPPLPAVLDGLRSSGAERGYPASVGSVALREAASGWMERRLGVSIEPSLIAACIGTKELVAGVPSWLRLRTPSRDTVLYPALAYPTYEMGALLARCRAVPVASRDDGTLDLESIDPSDADRALVLWVNSPGNPAGQLEDLGAVASWGADHGVPVFSDECYVEFTWADRPRTILEHGSTGVVAVHSLSKRSNLAGLRVGVFAGDPDLVRYLGEVRRHAGFMVPGPAQFAASIALGDDAHVDVQRDRYRSRLERISKALSTAGIACEVPDGSFYLWVRAPGELADEADRKGESRGWALARWLAERAGVLASPGATYGTGGAGHVRLALVQPDRRIELVERRLEEHEGSFHRVDGVIGGEAR